ncbi:MAG: OmpA family protein, partial [Hyphomonas sp.]
MRLCDLFAAFLLCACAFDKAFADQMQRAHPPPSCDALLNKMLTNAAIQHGGVVELGWRDTIELEHCDRMKRLERIAKIQGLGAKPEFYDASIAAHRLPPDVGVRIPLLRVVFPDRVFFDTDKSTLRPEAVEVVRIVAESLQHEPPDVALFIAGHADERGASDYNLNLSIDRADALADAILDYGVEVASVWRVGFGEDLPLVAGSNEYAWGQNRRIEFLFAARPEAIAVWAGEDQVDLLCQSTNR